MNKKVLRNKSFLMSNTVNRKKMYKAGKQWIVGNALVLAVLGGASVATHASAHADTNGTQQTVKTSQSKPTTSNIQKPTPKITVPTQPTNKDNNDTQQKPSAPTPKKVTKQANNVHQNLVNAMQNSQNNGNNKKVVGNPKPKQPVNPVNASKATGKVATKPKSLGASNPVSSPHLTQNLKDTDNITTQAQPSDNHWIYDNGKYINAMPSTDTISDGTYDGLNYKYDEMLQALEFTGGSINASNTKSFLATNKFGATDKESDSPVYNANLQSVKFDDGINTNKVTNMSDMFAFDNLASVDLGNNFNACNAKNMNDMFNQDAYLQSVNLGNNFNSINATNMSEMFNNDRNLKFLNLGNNFNTSNVRDMNSMFSGDSDLTSLNVSNFDTHNVTNMENMFSQIGCKSLNLSNFNTSNVTNMSDMFSGDSDLTSLDVSNFDTHNVTNMESMFDGDNKLTSLDVSNFDTHNVTNMSDMFYGDSDLTSLDVSNFDTHNVTNMGGMFFGVGCKSLNLSNFNTNKVSNIHDALTNTGMFQNDNNLQSIILGSDFNTSNISDMSDMFKSDVKLSRITIKSNNTKLPSSVGLSNSKPNTKELSKLNTLLNDPRASGKIVTFATFGYRLFTSHPLTTLNDIINIFLAPIQNPRIKKHLNKSWPVKERKILESHRNTLGNIQIFTPPKRWYKELLEKSPSNTNYTSPNENDFSKGNIGTFIPTRNVPKDTIKYMYGNQPIGSHQFIGNDKHYDNNGYTPLTYSDLSNNAPAGYDLLNAGNIPFDGNTHSIYMSPKMVGGTATINLIYQRGNHSYIRKAHVNLSSNIGDPNIKINPEDYDKVGYHLVSPKSESDWSIPFDYSDVNSVSHGDLSRYNVENTFVYKATPVDIDIQYVDAQTGQTVNKFTTRLSDVAYDGDTIDLEDENASNDINANNDNQDNDNQAFISVDGHNYRLNVPTGYHLAHTNNYIKVTANGTYTKKVSNGLDGFRMVRMPLMKLALNLTLPAHHSAQPSTSTTPTSSASPTTPTNTTPIPSNNNTTITSNSAVLPQVSLVSSSASQVSSVASTNNSSIASVSPTFVTSNTSKVQPKTNTSAKPSNNNVVPKSVVPTLSSNSSQIKPIHQTKKSNHQNIPMIQQTIPHSYKKYESTGKNNIDNTSHSVAVAKPTKSSTTDNSPIRTQLFTTEPLSNNNSAESNNALKVSANSNSLNNNEVIATGKLPQTNEATNYAGITAMVALMLDIGLVGVDLKRRYE